MLMQIMERVRRPCGDQAARRRLARTAGRRLDGIERRMICIVAQNVVSRAIEAR
jgi:hypothetical protein